MRVTLASREVDGILPWHKSFFVDCTVLFSEEEKAIIRIRGLGQHYFAVGPETPPPANSLKVLSILLQVCAPFLFLVGCVVGLGMTIVGNSRGGDGFTGISFFVAITMYLTGFAMRRHIKVANQSQQTISLNRLLANPRFSIYAFDNATAKVVDSELRTILANVKDGLTENARMLEQETFEL